MKVTVFVSPEEAVKERRSISGKIDVELTDDYLERLSPRQLEILSRYVDKSVSLGGSKIDGGTVGHADLNTVTQLIDNIIEYEARREEAEREEEKLEREREKEHKRLIQSGLSILDKADSVLASADNVLCDDSQGNDVYLKIGSLSTGLYLSGYGCLLPLNEFPKHLRARIENEQLAIQQQRIAEEEEEKRLELEQEEAKNNAIRQLLLDNYSPDTEQRFRDGYMTEDEARRLVRDVLYSDLSSFERYKKLTSSDVLCDCLDQQVSFEVVESDALTALSYKMLQDIRAKACEVLENPEVMPYDHIATCEYCDSEVVAKSARVAVTWHNMQLSREYQI